MEAWKPMEVEIDCPGCGAKLVERLANMRPGNTKACPHCSATLNYEGDDASKIERDLKGIIGGFESAIRRLGSR